MDLTIFQFVITTLKADESGRAENARQRATTRFLLRNMLMERHVHWKLRSLMAPDEISAIHFESAPVVNDDEFTLFEILFTSGQFIPSSVSRRNFKEDIVNESRKLFLKFSMPKTKETQLKRVDFKSMVWWWNSQVSSLHGEGVMLTSPIKVDRPGMINPQFSIGELAKLSKIGADNLRTKNHSFMKSHTVEYAASRARKLVTSVLAAGPDIKRNCVTQKEAKDKSVPFCDVGLNAVPRGNGSIGGKCITDAQ